MLYTTKRRYSQYNEGSFKDRIAPHTHLLLDCNTKFVVVEEMNRSTYAGSRESDCF